MLCRQKSNVHHSKSFFIFNHVQCLLTQEPCSECSDTHLWSLITNYYSQSGVSYPNTDGTSSSDLGTISDLAHLKELVSHPFGPVAANSIL